MARYRYRHIEQLKKDLESCKRQIKHYEEMIEHEKLSKDDIEKILDRLDLTREVK